MPVISPGDPFGNALAPLERSKLPPELDGRHGLNRAIGVRAQIAAENDVDAIKAWLARFVEHEGDLRHLSQGSPNACCCGRPSNCASRSPRSRTKTCSSTGGFWPTRNRRSAGS